MGLRSARLPIMAEFEAIAATGKVALGSLPTSGCCEPPASLGKHIVNTIGFMPFNPRRNTFFD